MFAFSFLVICDDSKFQLLVSSLLAIDFKSSRKLKSAGMYGMQCSQQRLELYLTNPLEWEFFCTIFAWVVTKMDTLKSCLLHSGILLVDTHL